MYVNSVAVSAMNGHTQILRPLDVANWTIHRQTLCFRFFFWFLYYIKFISHVPHRALWINH